MAILGDAETFPLEQFDGWSRSTSAGCSSRSSARCAHLGEGGRIINIGSINADRVPGPGLAVYAMTKAAVAGLTRGLARDLGPSGITVNNVQPGPIDTDMNPDEGEFAEMAKQVMASGHYGHPATSQAWSAIWQAPTPATSPVRTGTSTAGSPSSRYRLIGSDGSAVFVVSRSAALNCIARYGHPSAVFHCDTTKPAPPWMSNRDPGNTYPPYSCAT